MQVPGLIVMALNGAGGAATPVAGAAASWEHVLVVFNANPGEVTYRYPAFTQVGFALHPAQAGGADPVVKQARFDRAQGAGTVPGLTTAVFVAP